MQKEGTKMMWSISLTNEPDIFNQKNYSKYFRSLERTKRKLYFMFKIVKNQSERNQVMKRAHQGGTV